MARYPDHTRLNRVSCYCQVMLGPTPYTLGRGAGCGKSSTYQRQSAHEDQSRSQMIVDAMGQQ